MRDFASTTEIRTMITLAHISNDIDDMLTKQITKDEHKYLKYLQTYIDRYIRAVKERIDTKSCKRIAAKVFNYVPRLEPINSSKHHRVALIEDDFLELANLAIEKCCCGCHGKYKNCTIRNCLHDAFVPELNLPEEKRPCGYMFTLEDLGRKE